MFTIIMAIAWKIAISGNDDKTIFELFPIMSIFTLLFDVMTLAPLIEKAFQ